jgi:threonine dehydratase
MTSADLLGLDAIRDARRRIEGAIRRTPIIAAQPAGKEIDRRPLLMKLECLQVTGSFKPRGALAKATTFAKGSIRGLITASGGNHGLGVAYAARRLDLPAVVYLPESAPADKAEKLRGWGAEVRIHGAVWDDSNEAALAAAKDEDLAYIHAFADPLVAAGQGTLGLEILEDAPGIDTLVVAIGGGGLIAGVASAVKALRPDIRIIGVEPVGAPTHHASRQAGKLVTLDAIRSRAGSLSPRRSEPFNFAVISRHVDELVLVSDEEMAAAAAWLWKEFGIGTELAGAAGIAAVMAGDIPGTAPLAIVCGAGSDGLG